MEQPHLHNFWKWQPMVTFLGYRQTYTMTPLAFVIVRNMLRKIVLFQMERKLPQYPAKRSECWEFMTCPGLKKIAIVTRSGLPAVKVITMPYIFPLMIQRQNHIVGRCEAQLSSQSATANFLGKSPMNRNSRWDFYRR